MSGRGLCECLLSHLLLLWLCIILLPDDFPEKIQRHLFYIRNSKSWPNCCCNEDKNEPVCFSGMAAATTQCSLRENTSFAIRPQYSGSHKCAYLQFQSYLTTFLGHTVPFQEKTGHGRVFFELTAILVVNPIRWNSTIGCLSSKKLQCKQLFRSENSEIWLKLL